MLTLAKVATSPITASGLLQTAVLNFFPVVQNHLLPIPSKVAY